MKAFKRLIALCALTACATAGAQVKIALDGPPDLKKSGSYVWAHTFNQHLTENGIEVRMLPRGSVGGEAEIFDQLSTGLLEISLSDVKSVGKVNPFIYGVRLPYIFDDVPHMDRALAAGDFFAKINKQLTATETMLLALVPIGPQSGIITTRKAVRTPADMAALRMRALDDAQIALYQAWGSTGTIVPWKEVPAGLQTGVIDGYLNTALVPIIFGQTDIVKHFSDAKVIVAQRAVLASKTWYAGLSDKQRAIVDAGVQRATNANREWLPGVAESALKDLESAGVEVIRLSNAEREAFRERSVSTYASGLLTKETAATWMDLAAKTRQK